MKALRIAPAAMAILGMAVLFAARPASAQDLAMTNARVVVGNGQVINSGTIVVRGGKIVSVSAGAASTQGLRVIDAKGMSAAPGYIDAHKHVNTGPNEAKEMQALLEAGYTTILSGGGPGIGMIRGEGEAGIEWPGARRPGDGDRHGGVRP